MKLVDFFKNSWLSKIHLKLKMCNNTDTEVHIISMELRPAAKSFRQHIKVCVWWCTSTIGPLIMTGLNWVDLNCLACPIFLKSQWWPVWTVWVQDLFKRTILNSSILFVTWWMLLSVIVCDLEFLDHVHLNSKN